MAVKINELQDIHGSEN